MGKTLILETLQKNMQNTEIFTRKNFMKNCIRLVSVMKTLHGLIWVPVLVLYLLIFVNLVLI